MKNLKRVLSLGLALVMLLGCMMVAGAAEVKTSDLTDMADVKNVKAVTLLVDLGIINGIEQADGTYKYEPAGNIDRSSWAKMVYYVLEGNNSADPYKGTVTDLKDIAGWWAEGYIAFLKTAGIVAGDDLGNFNIRANIRVDEAAKMLLCAAGWDAEDRGYIGDSWSGSIMRDARKYGLTAGIDQSANEPLTRDNAAQLVYNAMSLSTRTAHYARDNGVKYVDRYDKDGMTLGYKTFGIQKATAVVASLDAKGNAVFRANSVKVNGHELLNALVDSKVPADSSIVGQSVEFFVTGNFTCDADGAVTAVPTTGVEIVSSALSAGGATLLATATSGVAFNGNWYDAKIDNADNDNFIVAKDTDVYYSVNGGTLEKNATLEAQDAGNKSEFYDTDGNGKADLVRVYNYTVGVVGKIETRVKSDVNEIKIGGVVNNWTAASKVKGAEGLAEGDVVLYYGTVIEKAESVKATPTDKDSSDKLIAGDTKYQQSELTAPEAVAVDFVNWASEAYDIEWTFYLDKAGRVCAATTEVETTPTDYVIVLDTADVPSTGGLNGTDGYTEAMILHLDGTDEIVKVVKLGDTKNPAANTINVGTFYEASKDADNNYSLKAVDGLVTLADQEITAALSFTGDSSKPEARNSTKFIVGKGNEDDGYVYTTYEGYKNVPGMTASAGVILKNDNGTAKYVYLLTDAFEGEGNTGVYYLRNASYTSKRANGSYVMNVVTPEGEEGTLEVTEEVRDALTTAGAGTFFQCKTVNEKGVVTALEDGEVEFKVLSAWADGALTLKDSAEATTSTSREYDAETVVIIIDEKADGKYDSASATTGTSFTLDTVNYVYTANVAPATGVADTVIVVRTPAPEETPAA